MNNFQFEFNWARVERKTKWNKKTVIETINSIDVKLNDWCGVFTCNWVAILYIWSNAKQQSPLSITYHSQHENTDSIQRKTHTIKYSKEGNGCNSCSKSMTSTFNAYWLLPLINTVFKAFELYTVVAILERKKNMFSSWIHVSVVSWLTIYTTLTLS